METYPRGVQEAELEGEEAAEEQDRESIHSSLFFLVTAFANPLSSLPFQSARNFRVRRKNQISTLESRLNDRERIIGAVRDELGSARMENAELR